MNPRYQIFVSSTFKDLKEVRERVIFELMRNGFIAVGMEQFHASDEEQMEYIRPLIDRTDYYVVIVKGRYGSVASDGMSYTEKEYRYALEKGVPVLAFLYEDIGSLSVNDTDNDPEALKKFNSFCAELSSRRIVSFWKSEDALVAKVKDAVYAIAFRKPGIGWIRGDQAMEPQVYKELEAERKKRIDLEAQLVELASSEISFPNHLAHGDDLVFLNGTVKKYPKVGVIGKGIIPLRQVAANRTLSGASIRVRRSLPPDAGFAGSFLSSRHLLWSALSLPFCKRATPRVHCLSWAFPVLEGGY